MARDTADQTLVKGAYAAAGGNIKDYGLGAAKGLTQITSDITETVTPVIQKRAERFNHFMEKQLISEEVDAQGIKPINYTDKEYKRAVKGFKKRKRRYAFGGPAEQDMLISELQDEFVDLEMEKQKKADLAKYAKEIKNMKWIAGAGTRITDAMKGEKVADPDGDEYMLEGEKPEMGYMIDMNGDGTPTWHSMESITKEIKSHSYDYNTQETVSNNVQRLTKEPPSRYNYDNDLRTNTDIVSNGNYNSMLNDSGILVPNRVFKDDFMEMLDENTYESLGIRPRQVKDPTPETNLTDSDKNIIYNKLFENERKGQQYLATYLTNFNEQNVLVGKGGRKRGTFQDKGVNAYDFTNATEQEISDFQNYGRTKNNQAFDRAGRQIMKPGVFVPPVDDPPLVITNPPTDGTNTNNDTNNKKETNTDNVNIKLRATDSIRKFSIGSFKTDKRKFSGEEGKYRSGILSSDMNEAVKRMTELYPPSTGFKFKATGTLRDFVTITAPNGKSQEFKIDRAKTRGRKVNLFGLPVGSDENAQEEIYKFMTENNTLEREEATHWTPE